MDQTKIEVSLEEYKEFIISQYEQGKTKATMIREINLLEADKAVLKTEIQDLEVEAQKIKDTVLDILFRRERMGTDTRAEQTQWFGQYFGFDPHKMDYLNELGYTKEQLIAYINAQWDEKEKADKEDDL
jgi:hypothetical protein